MKKTIALLLAVFMLVMPFEAFAYTSEENAILKSNTTDVLTGEMTCVTFTCEAEKNLAISLYSEKTGSVSKMYDDGTHGDEISNDGIYTVEIEFLEDETRLENFYATGSGTRSNFVELNFYRTFSDGEKLVADVILKEIYKMQEMYLAQGYSRKEIADMVFDYLSGLTEVDRIIREENNSLTFYTSTGIGCGFINEEQGEKSTLVIEKSDSELKGISANGGRMWTNPNVLLIRPFRTSRVSGDEGFHNETYPSCAQRITALTGGSYTDIKDDECTPQAFINALPYYGFLLIDCHGTYHNGESYYCLRRGEGYSDADISAGRVYFDRSDIVSVGGTYIQMYIDSNLPNTLIYAGSCLGAVTTKTGDILLNLGAIAYAGYDESVTFDYEAEMVVSLFKYMTKMHPQYPYRTYNYEEAIDLAKKDNGSYDRYDSRGAVLYCWGNTEFAIVNGDTEFDVHFVADENGTVYGDDTVTIEYQDTVDKIPAIYPKQGYVLDGFYVNNAKIDLASYEIVEETTITAKFKYVGGDYMYLTYSQQLENIEGFNPSGKFALYNDITVSKSFAGFGEFKGTLDGMNHTIKNIYIENPDRVNGGFVSVLAENAVIKNVVFDGASVSVKSVAGVVAGVNNGQIINVEVKNSYVHCEGYANPISKYVGQYLGVVAGLNNGRISYANAHNSQVKGTNNKLNGLYGGIVGFNNGKVELSLSRENSINSGIEAKNAGGLAGYNQGVIRMSATKGNTVYASENAGAFLGANDKKGQIIDSLSFDLNPIGGIGHIGLDSGNNFNFFCGEDIYATENRNKLSAHTNAFDKESADSPELIPYSDPMYVVEFMNGGESLFLSVVHGDESAKAPENPERDGYTFKGWDSDFSNVKSDMVVNAVWEEVYNTYTVTFIDGLTGEQLSVQTVREGEGANEPEVYYHEGYKFVGFDKDFSAVYEDMIVTALYEEEIVEPTMFTVTFVDGLTGNVVSVQQVLPGKSAVQPQIPEHEGYKFIGFDKEFDAVAADMTVTILYEKIEEPIQSEEPSDTLMPIHNIIGDVDLNDEIEAADATVILRFVAKLDELDAQQKINADANEDNIIDSSDATKILRIVAGLD